MFRSTRTTTAVEPRDDERPHATQLSQSYPNPFSAETTIAFDVLRSGIVRLTVYDLLGRTAATFVDEPLGAGRYHARWDAAQQPSGVYLYRLEAGGIVETRTLTIVR